MKIKPLISLFLAFFCYVSVFSQKVEDQSGELFKEFISVKYKTAGNFEYITRKDNNGSGFLLKRLFEKFLSKNGSIKSDETGKYIVITDTKHRCRLFKGFVETLDKIKVDRDSISTSRKRFKESRKTITAKIETSQIFQIKRYGDVKLNKSQPKWVKVQEQIAVIVLKELKVKVKIVKSGVKVTTTKGKSDLVKNIIELIDKPFLEEELN